MKLYNPRQKSPKLAESLRVSSTIPAYDGLQKTHLHDTSTKHKQQSIKKSIKTDKL
ncbi:MAG: hypothetical protein QMC23_03370 [Rubritalea sp.]